MCWASAVVSFGKGTAACWCGRALLTAAFGVSLTGAVLDPERLSLHLVTGCYPLGCLIGLLQLHSSHVDKLLGPGRPHCTPTLGSVASLRSG